MCVGVIDKHHFFIQLAHSFDIREQRRLRYKVQSAAHSRLRIHLKLSHIQTIIVSGRGREEAPAQRGDRLRLGLWEAECMESW